MILIDKNKTEQYLVLTLTEKTTVGSPFYQLVFTNDAEKSEHSIVLTGKMFLTNARYDLFILRTDEFENMPIGYYSYTIYQDSSKEQAIETGKLLLRSNDSSFTIISPIKNDEYLIYK